MPKFKGFEVVDKSEDAAEILIYGYITDEKWYDEDVTPKEFKAQVDKLKNKKRIDVYFNSGGGGVWAGMAIYNMLARYAGESVGHVDGVCASIASVILQACKKRICNGGSMVMIHNPSTAAAGDATELRKTAEMLDKVKDTILEVYTSRTSEDADKIGALMDAETWLTGTEAQAIGLVDEVDDTAVAQMCTRGDKLVANGQEFDRSGFRNLPENIKPEPEPEPDDPQQEPEGPEDTAQQRLTMMENELELSFCTLNFLEVE